MLKNADHVFVQHSGQQEILLKRGIKSILFNNLIDAGEVPEQSNSDKKDFIYVGSLDKRKGFAAFYDIVMRSPSHTFKVVGHPRDETGNIFYARLKSCKNVTLLGHLTHADTIEEIARSKTLISTSPMEGFPNVFIEAWACGVPVLSLYVDPGGIIEKEGLGVVTHGNVEMLLQAMDNVNYAVGFSEKVKAYVKHNHELNPDKVREIDMLLKGILGNSKSE
jgi:glycosyltransferase involved in cell wall biosynthesis